MHSAGTFFETLGGEVQDGLHFLLGHVEDLNNVLHRPASKSSKIVCTGMRLPLRTQAPLILPGVLSTALHCDQSSCATVNLSFILRRWREGVRKVSGPSPDCVRLWWRLADGKSGLVPV